MKGGSCKKVIRGILFNRNIFRKKIEKVLEIWRLVYFKLLNWIKYGVEGFLILCCFLEILCVVF